MVYEQTIRQLFSLFGCEVEDVEIWEFSINAVRFSIASTNLFDLYRIGIKKPLGTRIGTISIDACWSAGMQARCGPPFSRKNQRSRVPM
jgi:hypothetical protein